MAGVPAANTVQVGWFLYTSLHIQMDYIY